MKSLQPAQSGTASHSPSTPHSAPPRIRHQAHHVLDVHSYRRLMTPGIFRRRHSVKRRISVPRADLEELDALCNFNADSHHVAQPETQSHSPVTPQSAPSRISRHHHSPPYTLDVETYRRLITPPIFRRRHAHKRRILVPRADFEEIQAMQGTPPRTRRIPSTPSSLPSN